MTPEDRTIVQSLIAIAWADGKIENAESELLERVLVSFDATSDEAAELREYARTPRTLADIPVDQLSEDDREVLLGNAGVLMRVDGSEAAEEATLIDSLASQLGFSSADAQRILEESKDGALRLAARSLRMAPPVKPPRR
jgi:tellurite resistance protein